MNIGPNLESLVRSNDPIRILGRNLNLESISNHQITDQYLGWLRNKEVNKFLEFDKDQITFEAVISYINSLRSRENCDLLAVTSNDDGRHIGNISITELSKETGHATYGIMIGEKSDSLANIAGSEATLLIIDYLFSFDFISQIHEGAHIENKRASSLLRKIGFLPLSDTPDDQDIQRYFLTKTEWLERSTKFSSMFKPNNN